jgi:eukaryotic-like serine/threonine-protein kinase
LDDDHPDSGPDCEEGTMNEETLFHAALARSSLPERAAFLDGACAGKPALRAAVEALLAAHEASGPLLDPAEHLIATIGSDPGSPEAHSSIAGTLGPESALCAAPITTVYRSTAAPNVLIAGRYTLQEKIGEGGMGAVWVAKQSEPVKRRVALKLIKTGMDSRAVLQRFEQERQALAMMDHPNIARVFDGGLTPTGQPFFVMELVNGLALNRFCDEARLTPRERLELFVPICQAVQHAHQKGIVHRDLKPANILITLIDGKPVPKVIDFGVAKATGGKLTDESMSTQFGSVVGTLEYMSPEQAGFSGTDVDTRADIYSLGVILYELLTGLRPIDASRLKKAAITEMIRIIQDEEPSKPSTRLSTDGSLPSMAALRHTEPRKLMAMLRGELDWVVMKCLEKHRERRYETANGLAKDVARYLADEPVEARPPSAGYRLSKFLRRNKGPVLAGTVVLLALLVGLFAVLAVQAKANADLAAKNKELLDAQAKVQARYELAVEAIKTFHTGVSEDFLLKEEQFKDVRNRLLKSASDFYGKLGALLGKESDPGSRRALWQANYEVAYLTTKIGRTEDAISAHRQVLAARRALAAEFPAESEMKAEVGRSLVDLGALLDFTGRNKEAEATFREAESLLVKLVTTNANSGAARTSLARCRSRLGWVLQATGRNAEALSAYRLARADQEMLAAIPGASADAGNFLAATINRIALLLETTDKPLEAAAEHCNALLVLQKLADLNPTVDDYSRRLALSHSNLGRVLWSTGKLAEAAAECREALLIHRRLAQLNPAVNEIRGELADIHLDHGDVLLAAGKASEAVAEFRKALAITHKLADDNPAVPDFRQSLAASRNGLALALYQTGNGLDAEAEFRKALAIRQKLADDNPAITELRFALTKSHNGLGWLLANLGKPSEAEIEHRKALATLQKLADANPAATAYRSELAYSHNSLGWLLSSAGKSSEAETEHRKALATQQKLADENPAIPRYSSELAYSHGVLGWLLSNAGKSSKADDEYGKALALRQKLADNYPAVAQFQGELAENLTDIGWRLDQTGKTEEALGYCTKAEAIRSKLAATHPATAADMDQLANCVTYKAVCLRHTGKLDLALAACERALAVLEPLVKAHPEVSDYRMHHGETNLRLGQVLCDMKDLSGAAAAWKRACERYEGIKSPNGQQTFRLACCHASLAGLAGRPGSGISTAEGPERTEKAMVVLRQAVVLEYRNFDDYRTESALDSLRTRPDFQVLITDLVFPANPFAS